MSKRAVRKNFAWMSLFSKTTSTHALFSSNTARARYDRNHFFSGRARVHVQKALSRSGPVRAKAFMDRAGWDLKFRPDPTYTPMAPVQVAIPGAL